MVAIFSKNKRIKYANSREKMDALYIFDDHLKINDLCPKKESKKKKFSKGPFKGPVSAKKGPTWEH